MGPRPSSGPKKASFTSDFLCKFFHSFSSIVGLLLHIGGTPNLFQHWMRVVIHLSVLAYLL